MPRKFSYNGMELPDPDPSMEVNQVKELYTATYPELNNASTTGPEKVGDDEVYKFSKAVGAKG
jgi:PRTRC genetic system protein C